MEQDGEVLVREEVCEPEELHDVQHDDLEEDEEVQV